MSLLSRNPAYRSSLADFVDACIAYIAENNPSNDFKHSSEVQKDSDDQGLDAATNGATNDTDDYNCSRLTDEVSGQSITRTLEISEFIPLQDEIP
jgi:hypothetical protein